MKETRGTGPREIIPGDFRYKIFEESSDALSRTGTRLEVVIQLVFAQQVIDLILTDSYWTDIVTRRNQEFQRVGGRNFFENFCPIMNAVEGIFSIRTVKQ